jgi:hypothetical protein
VSLYVNKILSWQGVFDMSVIKLCYAVYMMFMMSVDFSFVVIVVIVIVDVM